MEDIVSSEEGKRFFDFLDSNWGMILELYSKTYFLRGGWEGTVQAIYRTVEIENESIEFEAMNEGEFDAIVKYFIEMGSSY